MQVLDFKTITKCLNALCPLELREFLKKIRNWIRHKIHAPKQQNPCIILMVDGGLGSQLGKYFAGQFLEHNLKTEVKYDLSWFETWGLSDDKKDTRNFDLLKVFPDIKFPVASKEETEHYRKNFYYCNEKYFVFNEKLLKKKPPLYIDGYFGHWKYLTDIDFAGLNFNLSLDEQNAEVLKAINESECPVALHVRRGDYVNSDFDVLNEGYFINAIKHMKRLLSGNNPEFFIFSTGTDWVKEHILPKLPDDIKYRIISNNNNSGGIFDFYLISQCKHQICSNSSFSWYPSLLNRNPNKKVIIPELWINDTNNNHKNQNKSFRYPSFVVMSNNGNIIK